jgi:hypothetical protein
LRDLFTEDRGGFYEDAVLLDRLAIEKLDGIAETVKAGSGLLSMSTIRTATACAAPIRIR